MIADAANAAIATTIASVCRSLATAQDHDHEPRQADQEERPSSEQASPRGQGERLCPA